jgi:acyl transferase domain-containing protein/NADP-dependent 3-hydroxy acid dehydrogenase YdfG/acyl carrier protein
MTTAPAIAVVGVAALFPGSTEPDGFWRTIMRGEHPVREVPRSHWLIEDYYDPDPAAPGKTYSKYGMFLDDIDFDPLEHGITPVNVASTDTAQLLGLIVARRVLEDACGPDLARLNRARTSVILGVAASTELVVSMAGFLQRPLWERTLVAAGMPSADAAAVCDRVGAMYSTWNENTFPGMLPNVVAGRIANRFDLGGTNCTTDAACASTLAAVHMAIGELATGTADLVVTGGVDALNDILMYMNFSKTPAMSASGVCRPFSEGADGTLMGEGLGMFALRRLSDAERDGDAIYAVLRGLGTSSDGRSRSIYAPRSAGQAQALRRAYALAGYGPETVELMEAHGTGTVAGDAAEIGGLQAVFAECGRHDRAWCALGSVKSQIGHTKAAAGAASLYKAIMALHHGVLPATINVTRPNPALGLDAGPLYVNATPRPWIRGSDHPRRASVSSFGFGGSNYHVTLQEYRGPVRPPRIRALDAELFLCSAASPDALRDRLGAMASAATSQRAFVNAARESQRAFRVTDRVRLSLVARGADDLTTLVRDALATIEHSPNASVSKPNGVRYSIGDAPADPVAFVFPGQGSQYPGMGADLAMGFAAARAVWDDAVDDPDPAYALLPWIVFPPAAFSDEQRRAQAARLRATDVAQPAIGVTSLAWLRVLDGLGVRPQALGGHSFGELTALHAAGSLSKAAFLFLAQQRGRVMADAARSTAGSAGMLAVFAPLDTVRAVLAAHGDELVIANENAPDQQVVAGPLDAIERIAVVFGQRAIETRRLDVATAFHSPIVHAAVPAFSEALSNVAFRAPAIAVFAGATGCPYASDSVAIRKTLAEQLAQPVRFTQQIDAMYAAGIRTFVEVGPGAVLSGLIDRILADRDHAALPLDRRGGGLVSFWRAVGALAVGGVPIDTSALWAGDGAEPSLVAPSSAATVRINGANFAKPYPPREPPAAPAAFPSTLRSIATAPLMEEPSMPQPADLRPQETTESLLGRLADTHVATQRLWAETHQEFLRLAAGLLGAAATAPSATAVVTASPAPAVVTAAPAPAVVTASPAPAVVTASPAPAQAVAPPQSVSSPMPSAPPVPSAPPISGAPPPPPPPSAAAPDREALTAAILDVIAQKTGYPTSLLELNMELEADLGIDSIKRVEILAAFGEAVPGVAAIDPRELGALQTIGAIVERVGSAFPNGSSALNVPLAAGPAPSAPFATNRLTEPGYDVMKLQSAPPAKNGLTEPGHDVMKLLLDVVAAKTGYPVDLLEPDMDLEADLGIDSIKRVEILAAFSAAAPGFDAVDPRELAGATTLRSILDRVAAPSAKAPVSGAAMNRLSIGAVPSAAGGRPMAGVAAGARAVLIGECDLRPFIEHELTARGIALAERGANGVASGNVLIALSGLEAVPAAAHTVAPYLTVLEAARDFAHRRGERPGSFVVVTDLGGDFGFSGTCGERAWLGGFAAMAKAAAAEWPGCDVKAIDVARAGVAPEDVARRIVGECFMGAPDREVAFDASGVRWIVRERSAPAPGPRALSEDAVFVVTGGARGVIPACLRALAGAARPRFAIFGRSVPGTENGSRAAATSELPAFVMAAATAEGRSLAPLQLSAEVRRIAAGREVLENLHALESAGAEVIYHAVDVTDAKAVGAAVAAVRRRWGRIDGIVHGAGVLADKPIAEQTNEQFTRVFETKVEGLRALLDATRDDDLRWLMLFSSVAARYGNAGQVAYAAANEVLNKVARAEAARRGDQCVVRSINWGPWDGGMVSDGVRDLFVSRGVQLLAPDAGAQAFAAEVCSAGNGAEQVDVVIAAAASR